MLWSFLPVSSSLGFGGEGMVLFQGCIEDDLCAQINDLQGWLLFYAFRKFPDVSLGATAT